MKRSYQEVYDVTLVDLKKYLMKICPRDDIYTLSRCISKQDIKLLLCSDKRQVFYQNALSFLYQSKDFESLEYACVYMNILFSNQDFRRVKKELYEKLIKQTISLKEYCVLRHLISFQYISFSDLVNDLYNYGTDALECAKICLIEERAHLAYLYLLKLEDCHDEHVLDLLCYYSFHDYIALVYYYYKKRKEYVLLPTH